MYQNLVQYCMYTILYVTFDNTVLYQYIIMGGCIHTLQCFEKNRGTVQYFYSTALYFQIVFQVSSTLQLYWYLGPVTVLNGMENGDYCVQQHEGTETPTTCIALLVVYIVTSLSTIQQTVHTVKADMCGFRIKHTIIYCTTTSSTTVTYFSTQKFFDVVVPCTLLSTRYKQGLTSTV